MNTSPACRHRARAALPAVADPSRRFLSALLLFAAAAAGTPADAFAATFRFAGTSNRIYVENGGTVTLSDIKAALPRAPLTLVDPAQGIWLLATNLYVEDGSVLQLHGTAIGGDVNELRLKSDNASTAGSFVQVTADYGRLDIRSTRIISWDSAVQGPDTEHATFGRAFVRARSRLDADGVTPLESRMDIVDSEIGWLGYYASEAYGLVWKVNGSGAGLFDRVQVRGDIIGSWIHNNYFGVYTYGHEGGQWLDNEVAHNVQYGFDPHDDSDNLLIQNNDVHDNGNHGIIASMRCNNLVIRNNRSFANTGNGIMLHRRSDNALVEDNLAYANLDSGIAVYASSGATIRNNTLLDNSNAGIRFSLGAADNLVQGNQMGRSGRYGIYFYKGSDTPEPGDDGRPKRNTFRNNQVHDSLMEGLMMGDADATQFIDNAFTGNGNGRLRFRSSSGVLFSGNTIPSGLRMSVAGTSGQPSNLIFSRQPEILLAHDSYSTARFDDATKAIFHPEETLPTRATPAGSSLALTHAQTGGLTTVYTRALLAAPQSGSVDVLLQLWNTGADVRKAWRSQLSAALINVQYTVGDLVPARSYVVREDGNLVGIFLSNAAGRISFSRQAAKLGWIDYTVTPP